MSSAIDVRAHNRPSYEIVSRLRGGTVTDIIVQPELGGSGNASELTVRVDKLSFGTCSIFATAGDTAQSAKNDRGLMSQHSVPGTVVIYREIQTCSVPRMVRPIDLACQTSWTVLGWRRKRFPGKCTSSIHGFLSNSQGTSTTVGKID